jgi:hypothetical protein
MVLHLGFRLNFTNKLAKESKYEWIYEIKHATDGSIVKFKERFVARGFS